MLGGLGEVFARFGGGFFLFFLVFVSKSRVQWGFPIHGRHARIVGQIFGIIDVFRWDFRGLLEDFWGYACRMLGGVLICFSYSFGCFLDGF